MALIESAPTGGRTRAPAWPAVSIGALVALVVTGAIWWFAFPRHEICPAIYPTPPGCRNATHLAWPWLGVVWSLYVTVVIVAVTVGRRRRWLTAAALGLLVAAAALAFWGVVVAWPRALP